MAEYRILILAYDFPPNLSIGGQRPWYWAKYLNEHSVYPIILTRHWDASLQSAADCVKPSASQSIQDLRQDSHRIIRIPFIPNRIVSLTIRVSFIRKGILNTNIPFQTNN